MTEADTLRSTARVSRERGGNMLRLQMLSYEQIRLIPSTAQRSETSLANSNLVGTQHSRESALY